MDSFLKGNKALLLGAIIVVALGLLLAGCGGGSQETPDENQGADTTPQEKIIRISASDVPNIDPGVGNDYVSSTAMCNLYDTLVFPEADGSLSPWLATDWTHSEDGLTWTFNLRQG